MTRTVVVAANGQPLQKAETTDTFCSRFVDADLGLTTAGVLRMIPAVIAGYWLQRVLKTCSAGDTAMCIGLCEFVFLMCIPSSLPFLVLTLVILNIASLATGDLVGNAIFGNRAAVFLGEISFSICLLHPVVQIACNQIVRRPHLPGSPTVGLTVLVAELFAVVVAGALCYYAIEVPARRLVVSRLTQSVSIKCEPLVVSAP